MSKIARLRTLLLSVALVLVAALGVHAATGQNGTPTAGITAQGYNSDAQTQALRTGLNATDANTLGTIIATGKVANSPFFTVSGRPNLSVSGRFSNSGQTCKVRVASLYKNGAAYVVLGISQELTLTASSIQDQTTSNYIAPSASFDSAGATDCLVLLTAAPGAGTVDLWVGSF